MTTTYLQADLEIMPVSFSGTDMASGDSQKFVKQPPWMEGS